MSLIVPSFDESVIVRSAEAETIGAAPTTVRLLADSGPTGGALSAQRVSLLDGANGAAPHHPPGPPNCSTCSTAPRSSCRATRW